MYVSKPIVVLSLSSNHYYYYYYLDGDMLHIIIIIIIIIIVYIIITLIVRVYSVHRQYNTYYMLRVMCDYYINIIININVLSIWMFGGGTRDTSKYI